MNFLERALELAERGRGTTQPNPVVGAVLVRDGEIVGEGWHERKGEPHAEANALVAAGDRARGSTLYVTLEPCTSWGSTPPCAQAVIDAGVARVVVGTRDPNPSAAGRLTLPGLRWISSEESRRLVHELRAASDAVAVGMGTARADRPALTARDVGAARQPRRLVFGAGPLPAGVELELVSGPLEEELRRLADEGIQSLLLEGGPTLARSFLQAGVIDKLLVFVAPKLSGAGPTLFAELDEPVELRRLEARSVGADVLLTGYLNEP
ncbi:MAG: bifunctional diaminohydroxyphosphoribosylaminopyrimidine deaminase/5-amino-6-(5-phosphoribosylamino)uracil reductase RibD [Actinobacteria bacterium]|nr:MAG: bifunctional diaminohydroxyphosphoribosylaminopyrimidine deaminase/5-amino-6-(5-phosphoribosylamino)uracil reductase RibD [Actinomycetota bacterium]